MIKLLSLFKDVILEGGNVFTSKNSDKDTDKDYTTADIEQVNIAKTVEEFAKSMSEIFPDKAQSFNELTDDKNWLGSTGRKQVARNEKGEVDSEKGKITSGDIDLAYSSNNFFSGDNVDWKGWGFSKEEYLGMYNAVKGRAITATEEQMRVTALLRLMIQKIEKRTDIDLKVAGKSTSSGALHFSFPQYNEKGEKLSTRAQIDLDVGDLEWLTFRNNANITPEQEKEGIKRLHRGQLMLALFATAGYTFKAGVGLVDTATKKERLGSTPAEAIETFNKKYKPKQPLTREILDNYDQLVTYVKNNLKTKEDYDTTMSKYLRELNRASAYIPKHVQDWIEQQAEEQQAKEQQA
jgi:hypothetical protein